MRVCSPVKQSMTNGAMDDAQQVLDESPASRKTTYQKVLGNINARYSTCMEVISAM